MREDFYRKDIVDYATAHSTQESEVLKQLREYTHQHFEMAQMQIGPHEGAVLKLLAGLTQAKRILELGTFTGYSALAMAEALPPNGEIITCDIDPKATAVAKDYWKRSPQGGKITLKVGRALDSLRALLDEGKPGTFDMAFIDADKGNYPQYYELCLELIRPGGLIVLDNALWDGRVLLPQHEQDSETRAIVLLNDRIHEDTRVDHTLLTIRDGMMCVRKR